MALMIQLSESVAENLREAAERQQLKPEDLAVQLIENALDAYYFPTLEEVVAQIRGLPFKPENIREATGSLRDHLASDPEDVEFDLEAWSQEWARVEEEMRAITRANDISEGFAPFP